VKKNFFRSVVCFFALSVLIAIVASMTGANIVNQKKAGDLTLQPYVFQSRSGERVDAEIGRLTVPENRKDPNTKLIELVFVRFKSTSASPGPPIVYLAGGPGGSGIATARGPRFPVFMAMREVADVIAFDQRATGNSTPDLTCPQTLDYPLDRAGDREEILRLLKQKSRECAEHWKSRGVDLSAYNTNESADDIESLRLALGAEKISLWGISYGTHLALATLRRHEKSIHQAILAGVEGSAHTLKLPSNIQANLEKINLLVKADANLNEQIPDLIAMMKTVLERLEKQPVQLETTDPQTRQKVKVTLGRFDLERLTASVIGNEQVAQIPALYHALLMGNTSHPILSVIAGRVLAERRGQIGSAMPFAMDL
jgi:pimeloyl-ACP methyl ester carboxylesterase